MVIYCLSLQTMTSSTEKSQSFPVSKEYTSGLGGLKKEGKN